MNYPTQAIANFFLDKALADRTSVSLMKLQKLVYFAHGWHFALADAPLIDEQVEAWQYGPVIPSLYHEFKDAGNSAITKRATVPKVVGRNPLKISAIEPRIQDDDPELIKFLDKIWEVYGGLSAVQISNLTHSDGTPWEQTWGTDGVPKGTGIDSKNIKNYFKQLKDANQHRVYE